jgi:hypothetical protein
MTLLIRELERTDTRVLGALRCVDATTGAAVDAPLQVQLQVQQPVQQPEARVRRNRSGLFVIVQAPGLAGHEGAFTAPPAEPATGSLALTAHIEDPSGRYLPRLAAVALPRDPAPGLAAQAGSLFRPIEVAMYPASVAPVGANWSVLRITARGGPGDALGGALVIVTSGGDTLARGLTDWRGEALVPVPGVPVTTWSEDPVEVVVHEIAAQVELVFDPAAGTRTTAADLAAGRAPQPQPVVNPAALEAGRATLPRTTQAVQLAAGRSRSLSLLLALP